VRTNPIQGGEDDGRGLSTNPKESQTSRHIGPTTRAMAKRLDEDWNTATDGRETYLYMFQDLNSCKSSIGIFFCKIV